MSPDLLELDRMRKKISVGYFFIIIPILILFSVYYWVQSITPLKDVLIIALFFHCCNFFVPYKLNYTIFRPLVTVYIFAISAIIYANVLVFWIHGSITAFMWFFLIPTAAMIFYSSKTVMLWSVYIFILICSIFITTLFLSENYIYTPSFSNEQLYTINVLTIICFFCLFFYFLYCTNLINRIKPSESEASEIIDSIVISENSMSKLEIEKYNELYYTISNHVTQKKSYCDPDFTISQLALEIESNIAYISRAIKLNQSTNFTIFINTYRINMVKDMLDNDSQNRYTIRHIYTSSGFRHQSTFNKVFKQILGITPSEYIKRLESIPKSIRKKAPTSA